MEFLIIVVLGYVLLITVVYFNEDILEKYGTLSVSRCCYQEIPVKTINFTVVLKSIERIIKQIIK